MNPFEKDLIRRLEGMGMEAGIIPGFIRNLANIILPNSSLSLFQINKQMHLLGWGGVELDYHTLQLAVACFEGEALKSTGKTRIENKAYS
ncbi:MAG: hypothetical protein K8R45_07485 [Desulfobacterales bacterium]|nr:hypothetical protein [Desulfobacterales bacterium]